MDEDVRKELDEMKLQIAELHETLHAPTTRNTTRNRDITPIKAMQKRVMKRMKKAQIMKAIKHYIDGGNKTIQVRDEIILRFDIKESCFYNYLRELHETLHEPTTRNATRKKPE